MAPQLDSTKALTWIWYGWTFLGLSPQWRPNIVYNLYFAFVCITMFILAPLQLVTQAFFVETYAQIMTNLSTSVELIGCSVKAIVLGVINWKLLEAHEFIKRLDKRADQNTQDRQRMNVVVTTARRIYIAYIASYWTTIIVLAIYGYFNRRLIFDGWMPFDYKSTFKMYLIALGYQFFNAIYQVAMNANSDVYAVLYTYVMMGHMQCLSRRVSNIGYDESASPAQNYCELIACIKDYQYILRYFDIVSKVIAATMFVQFVMSVFTLCLIGISLMIFGDNLGYIVANMVYLFAILDEVLPCCFIVSEMMDASDKLTTSIYSCNWMNQDIRFRKVLIIFMQRTQKPFAILALGLIPISLPTFMSLIRLSYSMFTLLATTRA